MHLPDGVMVAHVILVHIVGVRIPIGEEVLCKKYLFFCPRSFIYRMYILHPKSSSVTIFGSKKTNNFHHLIDNF